MLKTSNLAASAVLKGVTTALLLSGALATNAAAGNAKIKSASFSIQPVYQSDEIVVTSSDGKKWDKIGSKALKLSATMKVDTKHPGYVKQVGILLGGCNNTGCANNPVMYYEPTGKRDYHANRIVTFPGNKIPLSTNGIAVPGYGDEILSSCNSNLQADGATKSHSFNKLMTASFSANTEKAYASVPPPEVLQPGEGSPDYNGGDVTRMAQFKVKVTCKAYVPPPLALNNTLFMAYTHGSKGCPRKATVEAQFYTNRAGKIEFMLYRNDGAKQKISINTTKKESGIFHAYWSKNYNFTKSVDRKYMIAVLGHKYSSQWKPIVVKCGVQNDNPGPDTVTDAPKPNNDGPLVLPLKVTGELTLADSAPNSDKPRPGQAVFKIWATKPGTTSYKLTCSGNRKWEGTLPTFKVADKKYQAVGAANFQITKSEQIGCALRSTSLPKNDVIALATKLFKLVKRNPDVAGPGTVTIPPKPQTGKPNRRPAVIVTPKPPKKPTIKVAPVRKIACIGGKVSRNSCFCPSRTKKVKIGANAYRCIVNVVKPRVPAKRVIKTAPVRRVAPVVQSAPVKRVGPVKRKTFIGKKR